MLSEIVWFSGKIQCHLIEALTSSRDWHQSDLKLWSIFSGAHLIFPSIFHSLLSCLFRSRGGWYCFFFLLVVAVLFRIFSFSSSFSYQQDFIKGIWHFLCGKMYTGFSDEGFQTKAHCGERKSKGSGSHGEIREEDQESAVVTWGTSESSIWSDTYLPT